jgi:uncharacterized membrane protein/predicted DNA-binding protein (UPF0251 family)
MKLRQVTRSRTVTKHVDGEDVTYDEPFTELVPKIPFNLDALLRKGLFAVAVLMTAGAIVWGTVSIGSMLVLLAPQWAAYLVAGVFDLAWAACLAAEYLARNDDEKAKLPRNAGIAALAISMGAIVWHGHLEEAILVGVIGAAVSLVSKGVWLIALRATGVKLDAEYQALLRQRQQQAGLRRALAQAKRDQLFMDDETARLLAALEYERGGAVSVETVHGPDHEVRMNQVPVQAVQGPDQRELPVNQPVNQEMDSENQIRELVDRLKNGEELTKASVAELLGTSQSTAYRRLQAAKAKLEEGTGQYL